MPFYKVYGKWYHLQYSDYFEVVVEAPSPRAAILRAAKSLSDVDRAADIEWGHHKPAEVPIGPLDPEPEFWVGDDQIYQIRTVTRVEPGEIECSTCRGLGRIQGYVEAESGDS